MNEDKCSELAAGTVIGEKEYIIEKVLGRGGFGITYYARRAESNEHYAIKEFFISGKCIRKTQSLDIALQGMNEIEFIEYRGKFVEEAQKLAKLQHPNIVKIIDFFDENDTSYIVMPFIEGMTLQQTVEECGKLNYATAVNYIAQLSEAVGYIHSLPKPILHRDIKPGNVIITPDKKAILIDFGSAREFIHDKTQSLTTILTKGYAPIEQYSNVGKKGSYSDIYSLGAVFYFTLTGQKPMDATDRTMQTMPEPKELSSSIPEKANLTILKAMELKPENRYQFVSEFMDDLLSKKRKIRIGKTLRKIIVVLIGIFLILCGFGAVRYLTQKADTPTDNPIVSENKEQIRDIAETNPEPETSSIISATGTNDKKAPVENKIADSEQIKKERDEAERKKQDLIERANAAFNSKQYEDAFNLYKKVKRIDPHNSVGYNNFINRAKELIYKYDEYNEYIKDFLDKAKELKHTDEVDRLLSNYNK